MKHGKVTVLNRLLFVWLVFVLAIACKNERSPVPEHDLKVFNAYWHQNKAEVSSYALHQSRYGSNFEGTSVLLFVAEDFSKSKYVKLDEPEKYKSDATSVLKFIMNKEFVTGIYKYSMMNSVFTPMEYKEFPHSLKLTTGVQDWCGQSFLQTIWKGNRYEVEQFSYFEKEGDLKHSMANTWLEDEMWNKIRISPNELPVGEIKMIASAFYLRLSHKPNKVYAAQTAVITSADHYTYAIHYPELSRTMAIDFEISFPHKILGWKETYGINEVTTGTLLTSIMTDYWNHNHQVDEGLRDSLQLNR
jgi:hypothetical protein